MEFGKFTDASRVINKGMFLVLTINSFGTTRKVNSSEVVSDSVDADKKRFRVSKKLMESDEIDAIRSFDGHTRKWIEGKSLPFEQPGVHIIPYGLFDETEAYLMNRAGRREELVTALLDAFPAIKENDRKSLGDQFDDDDYPTIPEIRATYSMKWRFLTFETPEKIKSINRAAFEREKQKNVQMWAEAGALADQYLHKCMKELVEHMVDSLTGKKDGKKKSFYASTLTNVRDFLKDFNPRNINDNQELSVLADRLKNALEGVDIEDLKKSEGTRDFVKAKFEQVKRQLDTMMIDRPRRMISFDDEDAPPPSGGPDIQPAA
ncbi:MAG TPA: hypothetical protein VFY05_04745 [Candidatus Angelobacter sp.]|nr:hypothetical protein [Candidatus Angelobacter sp.]